MNEMNVIIARKLKQLRESSQLTQGEMAEKIGVALRSYQKYEKGDRFPRAKIISNVCKEFRISRSELFSTGPTETSENTNAYEESAGLLLKISKLNSRNRDLLFKSIEQMILAQTAIQRKKAN